MADDISLGDVTLGEIKLLEEFLKFLKAQRSRSEVMSLQSPEFVEFKKRIVHSFGHLFCAKVLDEICSACYESAKMNCTLCNSLSYDLIYSLLKIIEESSLALKPVMDPSNVVKDVPPINVEEATKVTYVDADLVLETPALTQFAHVMNSSELSIFAPVEPMKKRVSFAARDMLKDVHRSKLFPTAGSPVIEVLDGSGVEDKPSDHDCIMESALPGNKDN